jgi:hypothetical protein
MIKAEKEFIGRGTPGKLRGPARRNGQELREATQLDDSHKLTTGKIW